MPRVLSRIAAHPHVIPAILGGALLTSASCGSSTATSMTAPSQISRCAIAMQTIEPAIPAEGGTASVTITAARECAWSASVEGSWLSIRSGSNGQGDGTIEFTAARNPDPQPRRGAITANGQRSEVSQAAATCEIGLEQSSASFSQTGGNGQVPVRASSTMCAWSAEADADWIQIRTPGGRGSGAVVFDVPASTAPPRTGTITVAGQKFSVTQSEGCTFAITPPSQSVAAGGGSGPVAVATADNCPWAAVSNVSWLTVTPAVGRGPSTVTFSAAPTSGASRTGTAVVAGQMFTVTQSAGCAYNVQPPGGQVGSSGGMLSFTLTTNRECQWSAAANDSWIALQGRSSGSGDATIGFSVEATTGPARSGSATIAGQRVTITQSPGCSFSISPEAVNGPASGSTGKIAVSAGAGCAWTASSNASWLTISAGSSGSGNGEVQYAAAASTGPGRSGTLTVAGRTFTLNQGEGCAFTLSSSSATIDDEGGQGSFTVQTAGGCGWTASSTVPWLTIQSGTNGSGEGTVRFTASRNTGPSRSGAITAGGQTFTVTQGSGCSIGLASTTFTAPVGGGDGSVNVTGGGGCTWTATSNASWLSIRSGSSGTGNGVVEFTAAANNGPSRSGTLTIGGRTFTVSQGENCRFTIAPERLAMAASAGETTVAVAASAGCVWTASSNAPWIGVSAGASGSGNGTVRLSVQANGGAVRTGTATIAGQTFTIEQSSGCSFAVDPSSHNAPATGGSIRVTVTTAAGCAWTSTSGVEWVQVAGSGSGNGNGTVDLSVAANSGPGRTGAVTVAGRTVAVSQDGGCAIVLDPTSEAMAAAGGSGKVTVSAGAGCAWTAVSDVAWVVITAGPSGTGPGAVQFSVEANATGAPRTATLTIGGVVFAITQQ